MEAGAGKEKARGVYVRNAYSTTHINIEEGSWQAKLCAKESAAIFGNSELRV